jgi:SPP1 gp7 family putative phage head morphogenesis protein
MSKYWADRMAKTQANLTEKSIKQTEKQLAKYYSKTMKRVIRDFESTYNKVILAIAAERQPTPADLYKLSSYWEMQGQLKQELQKLGEHQMALFSEKFEEQFFNIYEAISIPSGTAFGTISQETAHQMINQIWCADGKSWSQRIWENTEKLAEALNEELIHCVVTGKKTSELKQILQNKFGASYSQADSLARTELAHIQTQAAQKRYTDYGIAEVEVLADKDERRCEVCGKLHQKRFPINAQMPVPAHPRCRCAIIPVVD